MGLTIVFIILCALIALAVIANTAYDGWYRATHDYNNDYSIQHEIVTDAITDVTAVLLIVAVVFLLVFHKPIFVELKALGVF